MPDVPHTDHGFGLFGPDFGVPAGGFCTSAFPVIERDGQVLVGRMDEDHAQTWIEAWAPNVRFYDGKRYERLFDGLRFPSTYLQTGEHPDAAVGRVWRDQLGFEGEPDLGLPTIVSDAKESRRAPGAQHWDLLFLYEVDGPELGEVPEHWAELAYRDPEGLIGEGLVMLHGELLDVL